jgi:Zn-dependent alcohol dehydrogenase
MKTRTAVAFEANQPLEIIELDEINRGFELIHAGESIRSVVVY